MIILLCLLGWYIGAWITKFIAERVSDIYTSDFVCIMIWPCILTSDLLFLLKGIKINFTLFPGTKQKK